MGVERSVELWISKPVLAVASRIGRNRQVLQDSVLSDSTSDSSPMRGPVLWPLNKSLSRPRSA
jgi:hypothetical protein